jgi:anti-sigma B factor antagonist
MKITEQQFGDAVVLCLQGPIAGLEAAAKLESVVRWHYESGVRTVVADLSGVPAVDLAGLGALLDAQLAARRASGVFKLAGITKRIDDLIVLTRLLTVFETYDTVDEALGGATPAYAGVQSPEPSLLSLDRG